MWGVHILFIGFVLGVLAIIGLEVAGILFLIGRLNRKVEKQEAQIAAESRSIAGTDLDFSFPNKQGFVWVLEKVPKTWLTDKEAKQQKRKKDILEVTPARKYARIKDQSLMLSEADGSHIEIPLKGCSILAVSATSLSSRKWAKRYPIKVESKRSAVYLGSHCLHMYFETSWEKESWCKALRLASCDDKEKLMWFAKLRSEFHSYLISLNIEYPSFMKPSIGYNPDIMDKSIKIDNSSSKVRQFLKKLKKGSRSGFDNKANWVSISGRDERKINEKSWPVEETVSAGGSSKHAQMGKAPYHAVEENMAASQSPAFTHVGSRSNISVSSDTDSVDRITRDEGTLCWNLLISRLFFDAKCNAEIKNSLQARVQRTLSNMRIPNYIGEVTCTSVDLGNLPPYIHGMRVLPSDMKEVVALEIDIEYSGGLMLNIETRLEVRELDLPESVGTNGDSSSVGNVTSDLLEGFEYFGDRLKLSEGMVDGVDSKEENAKLDKLKSFKSTIQASPNVSKWKSMLNSVAKQVSQVPLSLSIRVAALRGTIRLHVKPPPSDQLWFGFTSMPDIDFDLASSVGDHKINSGHIALFLMSRFKAAIRDTMVLPNCESIAIPFMLAEKDDWVPQKSAPFIWIKQEAVSDVTTVHQVPSSQTSEQAHVQEAVNVNTTAYPDGQQAKETKQVACESLDDEGTSSLDPINQPILNENPLEELKTPLLQNDEKAEGSSSQSMKEENRDGQSAILQYPLPSRSLNSTEGQSAIQQYSLPSRSLNITQEQNEIIEEGDDAKPKRIGSTRAKMLGLGKRVGEKLEEKRRTIETKGRSMVDRMRGP